jgi:hypothetical protein
MQDQQLVSTDFQPPNWHDAIVEDGRSVKCKQLYFIAKRNDLKNGTFNRTIILFSIRMIFKVLMKFKVEVKSVM